MSASSSSSASSCKLVLVGNGSVGKSSIVGRFVDDGFRKVYKQTVGLDFFEKVITLPRGPARKMTLQVWDIGGQSVGSAMLPKYLFGASAVLLCYDVTDEKSFQDVDDWLRLARKTLSGDDAGASAKYFLVGNKIDLYGQRAVSEDRHDALIVSSRLDGGHFVSAQSGENVVRAFYQLAGEVVGITLSPYELSFHDKVISTVAVPALVLNGNSSEAGEADHITEEERRIMEEDAALEASKRRRESRRSSREAKSAPLCKLKK